MVSKYHIKDKSFRETIDLTDYEDKLIKAIYEVIDRSIDVQVMSKYYEIDFDITRDMAIRIGARISYNCPELRELRKTYVSKSGISNQIFVRVR